MDKKLIKKYLNLTTELVENNSDEFEEAQIQYLYLLVTQSTICLGLYELGMHYSHLWHQRGVLSYQKVQARLFSLILHFELGYFKLIQSEIILLKKMVKKHWRKKELILSFYTFFKSISKNSVDKSIHINRLQKELRIISRKSKTQYSFDYYQWSLRLKDQ